MATEPPRFRPKAYPPPEFPPRRLPLFARMPPAVFPAILGLLGLGLALRRALTVLGGPTGIADLVLGLMTGLWAFAAIGYAVKLARRSGVLVEDLRVLPGRAGLAAATMGLMAIAAALAPMQPGAARVVLVAGLVLHAGVALTILRVLLAGPPEARQVTPVWHLSFVGFIVGGLSAQALGWPGLAQALVVGTGAVAVVVWALSARQFAGHIPPAPLRPLLAIHVAPAALLAQVSLGLGWTGLALGLAALATVLALVLAASARWLTEAGFSALWGAFTFPMTALAAALISIGGPVLWLGLAVLAAALVTVPWIGYRVIKAWAGGGLAQKTNAATA